MADNTTLDAGAGGDAIVTREISHAGDTAKLPGSFLMGVTGTEGSYTAGAIGGDATNGLDVDVTRVSGNVTVVQATAANLNVTAELGATDNAVLDAIAASLALIDNSISAGNELQVDVVGALPAGTNNIGDVDVLSVVPGTGATNLGKAIDSAGGATDTGVALLAIRDDALTTLTPVDGDYVALRVSSTGALHVTGSAGMTQYTEDGASAGGESLCLVGAVRRDSAASSSATDGDYVTLNTNATGALRVTVDSFTNSQTDDAAFTPGTSLVSVIGGTADEGSTDSVDEGDAGAIRMTLDRKLITTPYPHTAGGLSIFRTLDADETEEEVKATAGQIYGMWVTNTGTATAFVKLYNATAANVTVGTTTPVITIGIPGNSTDDVSGNFGPGGMGISFDTAISVAAVTEAADNGTTAPSANSVIVNIFYK
jgi:hypothetical protein